MNPLILYIETSADICSVALSQETRCIALRENSEGRNHATILTLFIEDILKEQHLKVSELDAVAVSSGPGSYTGLRIGLSTAKGLCYGSGIPLIAIPTLFSMSLGFIQQYPDIPSQALLCPMIDARRMEVYTALYDTCGQLVEPVSAEIITETSYSDQLTIQTVYFFGNGADKCRTIITHPNAIFIDNFRNSAKYMIPAAMQAYQKQRFEDVAYFEPFYLKDFIAGKPKQML